MMLSKTQCLYLFIFLYGGIILILFYRAFVRRRLIKDYEELKGEDVTAGISNRLLKPLLIVPRQMHALSSLKKSIAEVSPSVRRRHKLFQMLTWVAVALLVLLIISSFVAHQACGP